MPEIVKCKIIHGDQTGEIVELERPAAEAGQSMGTHRILDPDERPPELPTNSEVSVVRYTGKELPPHMAAFDSKQTREMAEDVTGEKFSRKSEAVDALKKDFAGKPTGEMRTDDGAADAGVAQQERDEDPRMQGTDHAVALATAKPKVRHSTASKAEKAIARKAKPTMIEQKGLNPPKPGEEKPSKAPEVRKRGN